MQAKSEKKKRKRMVDLKKQLEIVFSMNTSTLKMAVEHFKIQQPIVENNKLKEEIQLQSKKQWRNTNAVQEAVKKYNWKISLNGKKELQDVVNKYGYYKI